MYEFYSAMFLQTLHKRIMEANALSLLLLLITVQNLYSIKALVKISYINTVEKYSERRYHLPHIVTLVLK